MATTAIRRFGALSVGKQLGLTYALLGLLIGAVVALFSLFGAGLGAALSEDSGGSIPGVLLGVGAIIFIPALYGILGFIGGLIGAGIYNLVAGITGGIQVELSSPPAL
jgi:hypothetical protein